MTEQPHIISAQALAAAYDHPQLRLIGVQKMQDYLLAHLPRAQQVEYAELVVPAQDSGASALLPNEERFSALARKLGLNADSWVVAYDDGFGTAASRLIWTLHTFGHGRCSLLDGGLKAWFGCNQPIANGPPEPIPAGNFIASEPNRHVIHLQELWARIDEPDLKIIDARSEAEYLGTKILTKRAGHLPNAIHLEWSNALSLPQSPCFKATEALKAMLDQHGLQPSDEVVVYCQTHHRSSLSYMMLRHLGYERARGYHGSWSEWGNHPDTPIVLERP